MKLLGLIGCASLASTCLAGNWFSSARESLPVKIKEFIEFRLEKVGDFELEKVKDVQDVYELKVMNLRYDYIISAWDHLSLRNKWARDWYQKKRYLRQEESRLLVLANSDFDEVCKHYLGEQALYAGEFKTQYLPSLRFPLNFVTISSEDYLAVEGSFGGKKLLSSVYCQVDFDVYLGGGDGET
ncbi:MAG: hypothetical protein AB8G05_05880 [Oligoflexales bacterium]